VLYGTKDNVAPPADVERAVSKIRTQKNIKVDATPLEGADHFYRDLSGKNVDHLAELDKRITAYLERRLAPGAPRR